ncbi:MAG: DUF4954 family protein [Rikenellaceae bacterium]|jgi:carbonic anhydrase/acetyltransferase-like protein (isoleucine patch superfamily)|nr:DUF4954 family protein [Rikenellaceae bacterium]
MTKRKINNAEIELLRASGCEATDWEQVFVPADFAPEHVSHTRFSGRVELGSFTKEFALAGGVSRHSGIHRATIHNCSIGDDVLIDGVHGYIANYVIGSGCRIENVGQIVCEGRSAFGNNVQVAVLNETSGREVPLYDRLSASLAHVIAMYRHRPVLIERLRAMISGYAESVASEMGEIGERATILNTNTIRNVRIGAGATIENCTRLQNGSINSNSKAPVRVGDGVIAEDFIISSGAVVSDGAVLVRCFVGQACHVSLGFTAHDSLLFSNCVFENGEACAVFAGPFTVSVHKSSLLIAGMFSFMNAGSGTNQSNHLYKLGAIHSGVLERGTKTASNSYIVWPARVGAFSLVMGSHRHHSDTSAMPFSYLVESGGESYLVPGVNLRSVGTKRDAQKWPKRDKRRDPDRLDAINYNLLTPYSVYKMTKALGILRELKPISDSTPAVYHYQNTIIKGSSLRNALRLYDMAIRGFMVGSLVKRLSGVDFGSIDEVRQRLQPTEKRGRGEWSDLSGLLLPQKELDRLIDAIESGRVSELGEIESFLGEMSAAYSEMEWTWVCDVWERWSGMKLSEITAQQIIETVRGWQKAVTELAEMVCDDARKELAMTNLSEGDFALETDFDEAALGDQLIEKIKTNICAE